MGCRTAGVVRFSVFVPKCSFCEQSEVRGFVQLGQSLSAMPIKRGRDSTLDFLSGNFRRFGMSGGCNLVGSPANDSADQTAPRGVNAIHVGFGSSGNVRR